MACVAIKASDTRSDRHALGSHGSSLATWNSWIRGLDVHRGCWSNLWSWVYLCFIWWCFLGLSHATWSDYGGLWQMFEWRNANAMISSMSWNWNQDGITWSHGWLKFNTRKDIASVVVRILDEGCNARCFEYLPKVWKWDTRTSICLHAWGYRKDNLFKMTCYFSRWLSTLGLKGSRSFPNFHGIQKVLWIAGEANSEALWTTGSGQFSEATGFFKDMKHWYSFCWVKLCFFWHVALDVCFIVNRWIELLYFL